MSTCPPPTQDDALQALLAEAEAFLARANFVRAFSAAKRATAMAPRSAKAQVALSRAQTGQGALQAALQSADRALAAEPGHVEAILQRAKLLMLRGELTEATEFLEGRPLDGGADLRRLALLADIAAKGGRADDAKRLHHQVLAREPAMVASLFSLGVLTETAGDLYQGFEYLCRANGHAPREGAVQKAMAAVLGKWKTNWHFDMMQDAPRNALYRQAIERAVKPGDLVLEIGTGSGLLAMMAARAGAGHVVTCEADPNIAPLAKQIIAQNGYDDRITVFQGFASALEVGEILPRPADVLITEVFDGWLLGEDCLISINDGLARLVRPGARIVPEGATLDYCLIQSADLARMGPLQAAVDGFDLSAFNRLNNPFASAPGFDMAGAVMLTAPDRLFAFDFRAHTPVVGERSVTAKATQDGVADGAAVWFTLHFGDDLVLSNDPWTTDRRHWPHVFKLFTPKLPLTAGQSVDLAARYARRFVFVDPVR